MRESTVKSEVYWYTQRKPKIVKLTTDLVLDIVIIGGGFAGLMCAQKLKRSNKNLQIAIIEATYCGGGASGKSSGFITPDSELELSDLIKEFGKEEAKKIWEFVKGGMNSIRTTIEHRNINCDFIPQDSLFIANDKKGYKKVEEEYDAQKSCGYDAELFNKESVSLAIGSTNYEGAVKTKGTYGINSYLFCQDLKESLQRDGILIFEETPVTSVTAAGIKIGDLTVTADKVVVCTDRFLPDLKIAEDVVYHAQTFLAVTKPLSKETLAQVFPEGPLMIWDTDLIYNYYRIVEGNRLLIGASSIIHTYAPKAKSSSPLVLNKMKTYLRKKFPELNVEFDYFWPGLIGVSPDFLPIVGRDPYMKNVYFAGAGAGLPWAAALGEYLADKIIDHRDDFDEVFSMNRKFPLGHRGQIVLSKPISFALSHGIKKYFN